jgi:hypothetical protein
MSTMSAAIRRGCLNRRRAGLLTRRFDGPAVNVEYVDISALIDGIDLRLDDLATHPEGPTLGPPDLARPRRSAP